MLKTLDSSVSSATIDELGLTSDAKLWYFGHMLARVPDFISIS